MGALEMESGDLGFLDSVMKKVCGRFRSSLRDLGYRKG